MISTDYARMPAVHKRLLDKAESVMHRAYAPYAKFYVGAAVLTHDNKIYTGANVETASYVALCAERCAIGAAISGGEYRFKAMAVISTSDYYDVSTVSGPCGICRQLIFEFSQVSGCDIEVINSTTDKNSIIIGKISELMPLCWGPLDTETDISKYSKKK